MVNSSLVLYSNVMLLVDGNYSMHQGNNSSTDTGVMAPPAPERTMFQEFLKQLYLISLPALCITGVVGNALAFFVLLSKPLRRTSCSWYLAARSISDGAFLLATFLIWASDVTKAQFYHRDGLCQLLVFFPFVFGFLSVWLTVVVTVENYIRICKPFTVQKFCTVRISKQAISGLAIVGLILYNYPFWTSKVRVLEHNNITYTWCQAEPKYGELIQWLSLWDMLITLVIPFVLIIVLMVAITCSLITSLKRQSRLGGGLTAAQRAGAQDAENKAKAGGSRKKSSPQTKVTRMLFAVSFFFILLNGPFHCIRLKLVVMEWFGQKPDLMHGSATESLSMLFQNIYYASFAVNLIIYLVFGDNFRKQFKETYIAPFMRICGDPRHQRSCGACSEMTAMSTVRLEEHEARPDEQAALLQSKQASPVNGLNDKHSVESDEHPENGTTPNACNGSPKLNSSVDKSQSFVNEVYTG